MADGFATPPLNASNHSDEIGPRRFSVAELDAMFDANILSRDERIELVNGEIIQMNSQMMLHGVVKMRILKTLLRQLPDQYDASSEFSVQLSDNTIVDPDVFVTPVLLPERRYVKSSELFLAVEVADTSVSYDRGPKALLYAQSGITELWVVDVNNSITFAYTLPSPDGYQSMLEVGFDKPLRATFNSAVEVVIGAV
jgi:Uma2 family endonuclease